MARPVLGRQERTADRVVVVLDRDRSLVEAARRDPAQFDALYRKYLAQVYAFALYELADHHAAEDATERTFLRALAALPRFREQARAEDGPDASHVPRLAVPDRPQRRGQRAPGRTPPARRLARRGARAPAWRSRTHADLEADAVTRDEAAEAPCGPCGPCPTTGAGRSCCASWTR